MWFIYISLYIIGTLFISGCINECYKELKDIKGSLFRIEQSIRELVGEDK